MSPAVLPVWHRVSLQGLARMRAQKALFMARKSAPIVRSQVRNAYAVHGGLLYDNTMTIIPSRWNWELVKDICHFYTILIGAPLALIIAYVNVFIGPAKLQPIPEGYEPQEHEYERNPITRWIVKNILPTEQEVYEMKLHEDWLNTKLMQQKMLIKEVKRLQKERGDYKGYYHLPVTSKFIRSQRNMVEEFHTNEQGTEV